MPPCCWCEKRRGRGLSYGCGGADRCGEKDQLILWHSLLTLWNHGTDLNYDGELLAYTSRDYKNKSSTSTYKHARRVVTFDYARQIRPAHFAEEPSAARTPDLPPRGRPFTRLRLRAPAADGAAFPKRVPGGGRAAVLTKQRRAAEEGARGAGRRRSSRTRRTGRPSTAVLLVTSTRARRASLLVSSRSTHRKGESTPHG